MSNKACYLRRLGKSDSHPYVTAKKEPPSCSRLPTEIWSVVVFVPPRNKHTGFEQTFTQSPFTFTEKWIYIAFSFDYIHKIEWPCRCNLNKCVNHASEIWGESTSQAIMKQPNKITGNVTSLMYSCERIYRYYHTVTFWKSEQKY